MSDKKPAKSRKVQAEAVSPAPPLRVSTFTQEAADRICDLIAEGASLRAVCRMPDQPAASTVFKWLSEQPAFSEQYARACETRAEAMFEDMLDIADESGFDTIQGENGDRANSEWISRSKLRVDTRKWMLSKMQPKKYGDKITNELTGAGGAPLTINVCFD
jgi:hypothetical protein